MMIKGTRTGSTLLEVLVVAGILSAICLSFVGTFITVSRFHEKNMLAIKAELIAEEGLEALRLIKSGGWAELSSLTPGQTYYFHLATSSWSVTTTPEVIDGDFYRSFIPYSVSRDVSDNITESGGTVDPNTLLFDVWVNWRWRGATTTANYKTYMTNL
jgi:type II secretory pathway pseudopilin PulG